MVNPDLTPKYTPTKMELDKTTSVSRSDGPPKSDKNFKKVMDNKSDESDKAENTKTEADASEVEAAEQKTPKSIFDIQKKNPKLADLKKKGLSGIELKAEASATKANRNDKDDPSVANPIGKETNIAFTNPFATPVQGVASVNIGSTPAVQPTSNVSEIINSLVSTVTETITGDRTDTTITLKNPPMFEGAQLTVTEYGSAKGEFNISFQNLNNEARNLIDMNEKSLKTSLEQKGYAVHIVTTENKIEQSIASNASQTGEERGQGEERERGGGGGGGDSRRGGRNG